MSDDARDLNNSANSDLFEPSDMEGIPLSWDGNDAKILGLIHETGKYLTQKGLLQPYIKHRAVPLSNGRTAQIGPQPILPQCLAGA